MHTLTELLQAKGLYARCPRCEETFALRRARLYDATKPFPEYALERLGTERAELKGERENLRKARAQLSQRSFTGAATSAVGSDLKCSPRRWPACRLMPRTAVPSSNRLTT